jgi:hypothetical protein
MSAALKGGLTVGSKTKESPKWSNPTGLELIFGAKEFILGPLHNVAEGQEAVESTNQIARNQEYGPSSLHIRGQSPKAIALQNA